MFEPWNHLKWRGVPEWIDRRRHAGDRGQSRDRKPCSRTDLDGRRDAVDLRYGDRCQRTGRAYANPADSVYSQRAWLADHQPTDRSEAWRGAV